MNVPTITMERAEARERLQAYQHELHRRADDEYLVAAKAYEALADGHPVIQLSIAVEQAGLDETGRPKIAIARADRRQVRFQWFGLRYQFMRFDTRLRGYSGGPTLNIELPWRGKRANSQCYGYALVPMIPPEVRTQINLSEIPKHFILWEVEGWSDRPLIAEPPRDPLLLRPIHTDLYAVVAHWDLTELERLIMRGRREA